MRAIRISPSWTTVWNFGHIKYFNLSYGILFGVPILHELYVKSVPFTDWLFGAAGPFPATLRWAYAASVCYALAILLYQSRCPAEIKRCGPNANEHVANQHEILQRAVRSHRLETVVTNLDRELEPEVYAQLLDLMERRRIAGQEGVRAGEELEALVDKHYEDATQRYLLREYEEKNDSRPLSRFVSFALYLVGTIILLVLLLLRSYDVLVPWSPERDMWIKTYMYDGVLGVEAYTYSAHEWDALAVTLRGSEAQKYSPLGTDDNGREGRRYYVSATRIASLGETLGGTFDTGGSFTPSPEPVGGAPWACRQIRPSGMGAGCENFNAPDKARAIVICGMIAGKRRWFGGDAKPGMCEQKRGLIDRLFGR